MLCQLLFNIYINIYNIFPRFQGTLIYSDYNCLSYAGSSVKLIEIPSTSEIDTMRELFKQNLSGNKSCIINAYVVT